MNIDYSNKTTKVVAELDLVTIAKKTEDAEYRCCEEFLSDIQWIVHNTKAIERRSDDKGFENKIRII